MDAVIALKDCRHRLKACFSSQLDLSKHRDDLVKDCKVGEGLLAELKDLESELPRLYAKVLTSKDLPNKMDFCTVTKEIAAVKNKMAELSKEINRLVRTSDVVLDNQKRERIEIEKLDYVLFHSTKLLEEDGASELPTLTALTNQYVPLEIARETSLATMKETNKALEEVRFTLDRETFKHRDTVQDLKNEIKSIKIEVTAIEDKSYIPAVAFDRRMSDRRSLAMTEMNTKRKVVEDEIDQLKTEIVKDTTVFNANKAVIEMEKTSLEQKLNNTNIANSESMSQVQTALNNLQAEQSVNEAVLLMLEQRKEKELEEEKRAKTEELIRIQEVAAKKASEEKKHFAALWIQLRWKAHVKRQLAKQKSAKKGGNKRGKGKGKAKK